MRVRTPEEIGRLVRQRRKEQGLSQEALAERIGATRQWVRMLEQGKPRLELGLTLRAMTALGVSVDLRDAAVPGGTGSTVPRAAYVDIDAVVDAARRSRR